ncbi:YlxM family DNA-binding protein [Paenibacillus sp. NEAU-GSW1]|uniref:YlxM family DNA-binding protein n=1 Tax=Paenibacillus sp. NEAU-GSW1 TaxID=2682486 RepID=UPI00139AF6E2|nr:DNA-binding protein [Paenibacillus sp. NEAU-GSW1]
MTLANQEPDALAKTNRINLLFDFYEPLLTEKQRTFLKYYFHDDYTLGEIAAESGISRQAVYEHVKRAEQALESYESKLQLLAKHESRQKLAAELAQSVDALQIGEADKQQLLAAIERLTMTE